MSSELIKLARRQALAKLGTGLAGAALVAARPACADNADAAPKMALPPGPVSMASVGYRDIPYNGQVCAACVYFEFYPAVDGQPASKCRLVAGNINPAGWCWIWSPKG